MSTINSVSESQRSNRKDYRRLLSRITNCFRHEVLLAKDEDSDSLLSNEECVPFADSPETREYVEAFRIKVEPSYLD